ncbi:MAG TPA: hypothetical protein VF453_20155, partial [Burkholderiaceae bacterium]
MRVRLLQLSASLLLASLVACASRVERGAAMPVAPMDGSDRPAATPSARVEAPHVPEWLRIRLGDYDAQAGAGAPRAVYALDYRGETAFLVQAGCCDQLDPLIDARGVLICHPTGGYTGKGDGKCPAPLPPADRRREVWRHR